MIRAFLPRIPNWMALSAAVVPVLLLAAVRHFLSTPLSSVLGIFLVVWTIICISIYWRGIGEVAREGQKTAWFWGGSLGLGAALLAMMIPALFPMFDAIIDWIDTWPNVVNSSFVAGALCIVAAQVIGCMIYWIAWWIAKR